MIRPLTGLGVIEAGGIGPVPFCAMLLADMGASVTRVVRPGPQPPAEHDIFGRGKQTLALDLRTPAGRDEMLGLIGAADVIVEGFRPGVMEKLGLGPDACHAANPALVYGRMTGWGQDGPEAHRPGHDINYLALSGVLHAIGPREGTSVPPLNLVGDFGGGGLLLCVGVLAALGSARSGHGCVVDAAMIDGILLQATMIHTLLSSGHWADRREANLLDGGAYFYGVYETADGGEIAVGAIEPQFHARFIEVLGLPAEEFTDHMNHAHWPARRARVAEIFLTRTRDAWTMLFADADACVTPVLSLLEARTHPHLAARGSFVETAQGIVPTPAPRFAIPAGGSG